MTFSKLYFHFRLKVRQRGHSQWSLFMLLRVWDGEASWGRGMAQVSVPSPSPGGDRQRALWKPSSSWMCRIVHRHTRTHLCITSLSRGVCFLLPPQSSLKGRWGCTGVPSWPAWWSNRVVIPIESCLVTNGLVVISTCAKGWLYFFWWRGKKWS